MLWQKNSQTNQLSPGHIIQRTQQKKNKMNIIQIGLLFLVIINLCFSDSSQESTNTPEITTSPTSPALEGRMDGFIHPYGAVGGFNNFYKPPNLSYGSYGYYPPHFPYYGYNYGYNYGYGGYGSSNGFGYSGYGYPNGIGYGKYGAPNGFGYGKYGVPFRYGYPI
uniref:Uncharacterized protein n=1 Tax=Strigamia maritima TaxID=126957 RepID=T1IYI0_STRMM